MSEVLKELSAIFFLVFLYGGVASIVTFVVAWPTSWVGKLTERRWMAPTFLTALLIVSGVFIGDFARWQMATRADFSMIHVAGTCIIIVAVLLGHIMGFQMFVPKAFIIGVILSYPAFIVLWILFMPDGVRVFTP